MIIAVWSALSNSLFSSMSMMWRTCLKSSMVCDLVLVLGLIFPLSGGGVLNVDIHDSFRKTVLVCVWDTYVRFVCF